jgi:hypothetical protein
MTIHKRNKLTYAGPAKMVLSRSITPMRRRTAVSPLRQSTAAEMANQQRVRNLEIERRARQIANQLIAQREAARLASRNGRVFTNFDLDTDVIPNQQEIVTRGLFPNNTGNQLIFHTSSLLTATQKRYYQEVWNGHMMGGEEGYDVTASAMFSIAYGHREGSGSVDEGGQINDTPSRAIYSQYRLLCLEPNDNTFTINGIDTKDCYFLNYNRALFRERLDEGNIEINLSELSGSKFALSHPNHSNTSSLHGIRALHNPAVGTKTAVNNPVIRLVDDSKITSQLSLSRGHFGRRYNMVSGSIEQGVYNSTAPHHYGLLYPDLGIIVLSAPKLNESCSFNTATGSEVYGNNALKLFTSISHSGAYLVDESNDRLGMQMRSSEKVTSTHYFVRATNAEYNFTNNPTFVTGSNGTFAQPQFVGDPKVYITTIGMYNHRRELLAVAKLSQPLLKSFTREALIKVKLDF